MDIEMKVQILRACSSKKGNRCSSCPAFGHGDRNCIRNAMKDAATALSTLQIENEKLRAELEQVKQDFDGLCEYIDSEGFLRKQFCENGNPDLEPCICPSLQERPGGGVSMERYTYFDGGKWRLKIGDTEYSGEAVDRLAAYEDTGLEPEEIRSQKELFDYLVFNSTPSEDIERFKRLRALAQADREGRCVVLPIKLGTPVWSTAFCQVDDDGTEHPTYPWPFDLSMADEWGKEWFLTREEADAALRREQE